jgi:hypothetical protein
MTPRRDAPTARLERITQALSERDQAILETLARIRVATGAQLQRLHFDGLTPLSAARQRRRTLERLHTLGIVARLGRRIGGARAGSAAYLYALNTTGQRLLTHLGLTALDQPQRPRTPSLAFLTHRLMVTELYVKLTELSRSDPALQVTEFQAEPACWRSYLGPGGGIVTLKPDAYLILTTTEFEDHYFIEIDRATASPRTLARKATTYRQYWTSGHEQAHHNIFPLVLFLVPDDKRKTQLEHILAQQPPDSHQLYHVALYTQAITVFQTETG